MPDQEFRRRVQEAAARVEARSGIDPLSVARSMAVTTDLRLEKLPGAIGWGLAAMSAGAAVAGFRLLTSGAREGTALVDAPVAGGLVVLAILLASGAVACVVLARAAHARMPDHLRYEDAWAKLAVELWPVARDGRLVATADSGPHSRTEFLLAVRDGRPLGAFEHRAPFTRNP
jgi:hypothetical protein